MTEKFYHCTTCILYDEQGRFLLQHRDDHIDYCPGHWGTFGGEVEEGETPEDCAARETFEELAYTLHDSTIVFTYEYDSNGRKGVQYVVLERYDESQELVLQEGQDMGWFTLEQTTGLKMIDDVRAILEKASKIIQSKLAAHR